MAEAFYSFSEGESLAVGGDFVADLEVVAFGAGAQYYFDSEVVTFGASARTPIVPRTDMGVAFTGASETDSDAFAYTVGLDINFAVTDAFKVYGAFMMKDLEGLDNNDNFGYEISASYAFAGDTTLYAGYVTDESGYNALGDLGGFFMAVSMSF